MKGRRSKFGKSNKYNKGKSLFGKLPLMVRIKAIAILLGILLVAALVLFIMVEMQASNDIDAYLNQMPNQTVFDTKAAFRKAWRVELEIPDKTPLSSFAEVNISTEYFTQEQIEVNTYIYGVIADIQAAGKVLAEGKSYTTFHKTYIEHLNPIILLAINGSEWGGSRSMGISWTSAVKWEALNTKPPASAKSEELIDLINTTAQSSYNSALSGEGAYGPFQIQVKGNESAFNNLKGFITSTGLLGSSGIPMPVEDPANFIFSAHYYQVYSPNYDRMCTTNSPFKDFTIKNDAQAAVVLSLQANQSGEVWNTVNIKGTTATAFKDSATYWKYLESVTTDATIAVIKENAEARAKLIMEESKDNMSSSDINWAAKSTIQWTLNDADIEEAFAASGNTLQDVIHPSLLASRYAKVKAYHPIQLLHAYYCLLALYTSGSAA